jgi:hypothetical protein
MNFIKREFFETGRGDVFRIYPIGDVHIGADTCDEDALKTVVNQIREDDNAFWIGLGDYCDNIGPKDPRFSTGGLADWITVPDLADLSRAQSDRFLSIVNPIAGKCLALIEGNHETAIKRHYERDIFLEIVNGIKTAAGLTERDKLSLRYNGILWLSFYASKEGGRKGNTSDVVFSLHHGYVGGRLKGAKGLNMQRQLWYTNCDIALMGHSHNADIFTETVVTPTRSGKIVTKTKYGAFTGSFMRSYSEDGSSYAEIKGYPPVPLAGIEIILKPQDKDERRRIKMQMVSR